LDSRYLALKEIPNTLKKLKVSKAID